MFKDIIYFNGVLLAYLLSDNDIDVLRRELNTLKYSSTEISQICFLEKLKKLNVDNAVILKKSQGSSGVSDEQIVNFGTRIGLPSQLLNAFVNFKFTVKSQDLMAAGFSGKELGEEKDRLETEHFKSLLSK